MLKLLKDLFNKKTEEISNTNSKGITREMLNSFQDGLRIYDERNYKAALEKFDIAIETGIFEKAYNQRGYCLQLLGYHLDSIEDFTKAIEIFPSNANNYYGRALSNGALGYYDDAISDATKAVELSLVSSKENLEVNQVATERKIMRPTQLYKDYIDELYLRKNETNERIRSIYIKPAIRREL
jgi:tetratricopeptide (TPR) repeat protein